VRWVLGPALWLGLLVGCQEPPLLPEVSPEVRLQGVVWQRLTTAGPSLTFAASGVDASLLPGRAHQLGDEGFWQRWQAISLQMPHLTIAPGELGPAASGSNAGPASAPTQPSAPTGTSGTAPTAPTIQPLPSASGGAGNPGPSPSLLPLPSSEELLALNRASLELQAQKGLGRRQDNSVQFEGGVTVTRGTLTLSCDSLQLQLGADGRPQRLQATGRVRLQWGRRTGSAGQARWDEPSGELVLEQNPVLSEAGQRLQGGLIRWNLREGVVSCEQCRLSLPGEVSP